MQNLRFLSCCIFLCLTFVFISANGVDRIRQPPELKEVEWMIQVWDAANQESLRWQYSPSIPSGIDYTPMLKDILKSARRGDASSQFLAGFLYEGEMWFWDRDDKAAVKWYKKAVSQGETSAQYHLGRLYFKGRGVPHNDVEAARWFEKAAEKGHLLAQCYLGFMYEAGRGVGKDVAKAASFYQKAASQGESFAQFHLGRMYEAGRGVPKDEQKAMELFLKAAEEGEHAYAKIADTPYQILVRSGDSFALRHLGKIYEEGRGVPKDEQKALEWFEKAVKWGNAFAKNDLGKMYAEGRGVPQDVKKAVELFEKAAEKGYAEAQFQLGKMYEEKRVELDEFYRERAAEWYQEGAASYYREAAEQGHEEARVALQKMGK